MKNLKYLAIIFLIISCNGIKKLNIEDNNNISTISGLYQNDTINGKNIVQLLNRKLIKDTLYSKNIQDYNKFAIKEIDDKKLKIIFYKNNIQTDIREFDYKKADNIYLLKNKNVRIVGVPFLAGIIDSKRLYFYKKSDNSLEIKNLTDRSGAILLVMFLFNEHHQKTITYKNLEN